jgi:transcriptional regulator with XRE-family HTH domain
MATDKVDRSAFGRSLRRALDDAGLNQADLASKLGVSPALVNQWIKGTKACPQLRAEEIGRLLGVATSFLIGGTGKLRRAPEFEPRWEFRAAPDDGGRDYGNSNVFATPPDIRAQVREPIQNSKDQGEAPCVHVRYALIELRLGTPEYDEFLQAMRFTELRAHLAAAGTTDSRVGKKLRNALSRLEESKKFYLLRIDDFGTTGLHGDEKSGLGHNPFAALIRNNLDSSKTGDTSGGSYGLGKAVLWRCSGISTVLFSTKVAKRYCPAGRSGQVRFIAKSELTWHEIEGSDHAFAGPGWLGSDAESIWCEAEQLAPLFLDRISLPSGVTTSDSSGTSALIVDFRDLQSDEELNPDSVLAKLREEAAVNFWPAIEAGELSVSIEYFVGSSHKRTDLVDPVETAARPFVEAYRAFLAGEHAARPEAGETAKAEVMLTVPATRDTAVAVEPRQASVDANCTLLVRLATDDDMEPRHLLGSVAMFRGRGMVVQYWSQRNIVVGGRSFHAVLMAGEAAEKNEPAKAAELFLRLSEPPAHDKWESSEDVNDNYKPGARSRLIEMQKEITARIKEIIRPDDDGVEDEPEELKRLLQIGSTEPHPKLARLSHTSRFDGSRWFVNGEVKILDRRSGIDARVEISIVPESGTRTSIGWESIDIKKKIRGEAEYLADAGIIRIEPRTSTIRFEAISMPGPGGLRLDRCMADVQFSATKSSEALSGEA